MPDGGSEADTRIPVTVVTGFLGAGKTTLLNRILNETRDRRLAVVVNEFGDIGIDGELIDSGPEDLIELSSGCVCCAVRGDLIRTLRELAQRVPDLDGVLIETTGLADPSPVIQTFFADQILAARFRLDCVVTVVDALHFADQLRSNAEVADQIALADLIVLNKASGAPGIEATASALQTLNPLATIIRTDRGRIEAGTLLERQSFDPARISDRLSDLPEPHDHVHDHIAEQGIASVSLTCSDPIDAVALERWLGDLLAVKGPDILRTKGVIRLAGEERNFVIQAVHMLIEGEFAMPRRGSHPQDSRIVFIGRELEAEPLERGFRACAAHRVT